MQSVLQKGKSHQTRQIQCPNQNQQSSSPITDINNLNTNFKDVAYAQGPQDQTPLIHADAVPTPSVRFLLFIILC